MKHVFSSIIASLFMSSTAFTQEASHANVFKADTSHPDLASTINAFEQACMPFVLHQTELTHENNKRHMTKFMQNNGFVFEKSIVDKPVRLSLGPKPPSKKDVGDEITSKPTSFTVYNGTSSKVVTSTETIVSQTGEFSRPARPPALNLITVQKEETFYTHDADPRLTVGFTWNLVHSKRSSGRTCFINLEQTTLSQTDFIENFIRKDEDWVNSTTPQSENIRWSQCVEDGDDEFKFGASLAQGNLKLTMLRSDFLLPKICHN